MHRQSGPIDQAAAAHAQHGVRIHLCASLYGTLRLSAKAADRKRFTVRPSTQPLLSLLSMPVMHVQLTTCLCTAGKSRAHSIEVGCPTCNHTPACSQSELGTLAQAGRGGAAALSAAARRAGVPAGLPLLRAAGGGQRGHLGLCGRCGAAHLGRRLRQR